MAEPSAAGIAGFARGIADFRLRSIPAGPEDGAADLFQRDFKTVDFGWRRGSATALVSRVPAAQNRRSLAGNDWQCRGHAEAVPPDPAGSSAYDYGHDRGSHGNWQGIGSAGHSPVELTRRQTVGGGELCGHS